MATIQFKDGVYSFQSKNGKTYKSKNQSYIVFQMNRLGENEGSTEAEAVEEKKPDFSINERFEFIENYVTMVADKIQPSLLISGPGGLGKSYVVNKSLKQEGFKDVTNIESFVEGERLPTKHYKTVKGYSTPKSLYRLLYENKDSILIFDDCDSVISDPTAANLLKGALDSNSERIISWNAESIRGEDDLPRTFRFTGGVIFITNLHKDKIPQALRTRSVCIDVSMQLDEKIERMKHIMIEDEFMPEAGMSVKLHALSIVEQFKNQAREVSMRSLMQVIRIGMKYTDEKFEKMAQYSLCN